MLKHWPYKLDEEIVCECRFNLEEILLAWLKYTLSTLCRKSDANKFCAAITLLWYFCFGFEGNSLHGNKMFLQVFEQMTNAFVFLGRTVSFECLNVQYTKRLKWLKQMLVHSCFVFSFLFFKKITWYMQQFEWKTPPLLLSLFICNGTARQKD